MPHLGVHDSQPGELVLIIAVIDGLANVTQGSEITVDEGSVNSHDSVAIFKARCVGRRAFLDLDKRVHQFVVRLAWGCGLGVDAYSEADIGLLLVDFNCLELRAEFAVRLDRVHK